MLAWFLSGELFHEVTVVPEDEGAGISRGKKTIFISSAVNLTDKMNSTRLDDAFGAIYRIPPNRLNAVKNKWQKSK